MFSEATLSAYFHGKNKSEKCGFSGCLEGVPSATKWG